MLTLLLITGFNKRWDNVKTMCESGWSKKCSWNTEITEKEKKVTALEITDTESTRTAHPEILLKLSGTHSWCYLFKF